MSKINFFKITLIVLFFLTIASANDAEIKTIFKTKGVNGTLIISSLNGDYNYIYNKKRSIKQYLPASTFKLPNTLIALDENIIEDENEIIKWDGKKRTYDAWNKDQSLSDQIAEIRAETDSIRFDFNDLILRLKKNPITKTIF